MNYLYDFLLKTSHAFHFGNIVVTVSLRTRIFLSFFHFGFLTPKLSEKRGNFHQLLPKRVTLKKSKATTEQGGTIFRFREIFCYFQFSISEAYDTSNCQQFVVQTKVIDVVARIQHFSSVYNFQLRENS
jgi:hypothetical protein